MSGAAAMRRREDGDFDEGTTPLGALQRLHGEGSGRDKILVVDDNSAMRMYARAVLGIHFPGFIIEEADDGLAALDAFRGDPALAGKVAMVFTDYSMPRADGVALAEGLRGHNGYGDHLTEEVRDLLAGVPVVLHTGTDDFFTVGTADHGRLSGLMDEGIIHAAVQKPAGIEAISKALVEAAQRLVMGLRTSEEN